MAKKAEVPAYPLGLGWWVLAWMRGLEFDGRSRRMEYWMFTVTNSLIAMAFLIPMMVLSQGMNEIDVLSGLLLGALVIFGIATIIPNLAVTIRRLHDTGRSGWWILINFVPYIGGLVLLVFMLLDSEQGSNQWGPSPKYEA